MEILSLSQSEFDKLEEYQTPKGVINTEAKLYIMDNGDLLKKYYMTRCEYFRNKIHTLSLLIENKDLIQTGNLIIPNGMVAVEKNIVGNTMPFIEHSINAGTILKSASYDRDAKIKLLKEIGKIINEVISRYKETGFLLGDVHEGNFIINKDDDNVYAVDLDGCKIGDNVPGSIKYYPKDALYKYNFDGIHPEVSVNSEILCYSYMVLNTIAGDDISRIGLNGFYEYLQYLLDNGFNKEFIVMFERIYDIKDNYFSLELLDTIPNNLEYTRFKVYKYKKRN